jgi:hypothetical protein
MIFPAVEWLATVCSHILNRGAKMRYKRFYNTFSAHSSNDNPHRNSKVKVAASVGERERSTHEPDEPLLNY